LLDSLLQEIKMFVLVLAAALVQSAVGIPVPQLTEQQFRARARSLDNEIPNNVLMISGYSQVRRQGGRAFEDPIKFPTLTVKNPNQLYLDTPSKVKVSLADPVYDEKELETIAQKLEEINQLEGQRIREEQLQEQLQVEEEQPEELEQPQELEQEEVFEQPEEENFNVLIEEEPINEDDASEDTIEEEAPVDAAEIFEETEDPVMVEVEIEEADTDATESNLQSFELNYEEQGQEEEYPEEVVQDNTETVAEAVEEFADLQEVPEDSYVEEEPIVEDGVVEDDVLAVDEPAPEVIDIVEEEVEEGSGASNLVEDMSLDVSDADGFIIEEVTSTLPPIDFGDIQEI